MGSGGGVLRVGATAKPRSSIHAGALTNVEVFLQLLKSDWNPDPSPAAVTNESRSMQLFLANPMANARRRDASHLRKSLFGENIIHSQ